MKTQSAMGNGTIESLFEEYTGQKPASVERLAGAGSNRKYFRLKGHGGSVIGVIGDDVEENRAFCSLAGHFRSRGINVPEVYAVGRDFSCYLQEDLGDVCLFDAVACGRESGKYSDEEKSLLLKTVAMLPEIQCEGARGLDYSVCYPEPAFCRRTVMSDLNYFKFCFLKAVGVVFNEVLLDEDFSKMADELLDGSWDTFMYRDFQARNVMLRDGEPYFIDFQGGRRGPFYYDLVSFVWQARARYPEELKEEMISTYVRSLSGYVPVDESMFRRRLRAFVLFRTLQVLGAYGFRGYFERKPHFLASIPFAVANLREMLPLDDYPTLGKVLQELVAMPRFAAGESEGMTSGCFSGCHGGTGVLNGTSGMAVGKSDGVRTVAGSCGNTDLNGGQARLTVDVCSFSYKKGIPEDLSGNGGGYVFDCRSIHNPGRYEQYKGLTGKDWEVMDFLENDGEVFHYLEHVYGVVDPHVETFMRRGFTHLMVSFGCTGGQHRSVYCAESLARHLREKYDIDVVLKHREQASWPVSKVSC